MNTKRKIVIITNGQGRSGKDTFVNIIGKYYNTKKTSSIDFVKNLVNSPLNFYLQTEGKTEQYRKLLSDIKQSFLTFSPYYFTEIMKKEINSFIESDYEILAIDIREPKEIEKLKESCNNMEDLRCYTILLYNDRNKKIVSNNADANVYDYTYDYLIDNNGTLNDLRESAITLLKDIM